MTSYNPEDLCEEIKLAWAGVDVPPAKDMAIMAREYGEEAMVAFGGVRPVDVDIESAGFRAATPLLDLPGNAAAAYLGPYLVSLLEGFEIQEVVGYPIEVNTLGHTIYALSSPNFWMDIASPHLNDECVSILGKVTRFIIDNGHAFLLDEEEKRGLERLVRSIDRRLKQSHGRSPR